jgi:hypothetical protein
MNENELQNEFLRVAVALSKSQLCSSGGGLLQGKQLILWGAHSDERGLKGWGAFGGKS